jgi:hypothetical protein
MTHESEILSTINDMQGSGKTFAEFIANLFKGKIVEIYLGDSYEEVSTEQISSSYPAVIAGKVIGAYRECLILDAGYVDRISRQITHGNHLFLSERAIRAINEVNGQSVFEDSLLRSRESLDVWKAFNKK